MKILFITFIFLSSLGLGAQQYTPEGLNWVYLANKEPIDADYPTKAMMLIYANGDKRCPTGFLEYFISDLDGYYTPAKCIKSSKVKELASKDKLLVINITPALMDTFPHHEMDDAVWQEAARPVHDFLFGSWYE